MSNESQFILPDPASCTLDELKNAHDFLTDVVMHSYGAAMEGVPGMRFCNELVSGFRAMVRAAIAVKEGFPTDADEVLRRWEDE